MYDSDCDDEGTRRAMRPRWGSRVGLGGMSAVLIFLVGVALGVFLGGQP